MAVDPIHTSAPNTGPNTRPAANRLMLNLPLDVQRRLQSSYTRVPMERGAILVESGLPVTHVFWPCSGLLSLQTMTQAGDSVEVAMVGRDGVSSFPAGAGGIAPYTVAVMVPGEALRMRADLLQAEFAHGPHLQEALVAQWHRTMQDIAAGSVCHRFHRARQRLARWLLMASDRTQSSRFELTQERLAHALGLQRTGVTVASVALQDAGAIRARHGAITLINRARLRELACECYETPA